MSKIQKAPLNHEQCIKIHVSIKQLKLNWRIIHAYVNLKVNSRNSLSLNITLKQNEINVSSVYFKDNEQSVKSCKKILKSEIIFAYSYIVLRKTCFLPYCQKYGCFRANDLHYFLCSILFCDT